MACNIRDEIRDMAAEAHYDSAKEWGASVRFIHRSNSTSGVTLYAVPLGENLSLDNVLQSDSEVTEQTFSIARQNGFPICSGTSIISGAPILENASIGDVIIYDSKYYNIRTINADSLQSVFNVTCDVIKARTFK